MIKKIAITLIVILSSVLSLALIQQPVYAADSFNEICSGPGASSAVCEDLGANKEVQSYVAPILKRVFFIIGLLAVGMVIFGGIRYVLSSGDPSKTATAKNTILYAIVGLIVSLAAYAITSFVTTEIAR
jgi:hypothetical protein